MTASTHHDVIDLLAGIARGDAADVIRANRCEARAQAQQSYLALFEPAPPSPGQGEGAFTAVERFAVATYVARLHEQAEVAAFYADGLARHGAAASLADAVAAEAADSLANGRVKGLSGRHGPYGRYPEGPLSREDVPGPVHAVAASRRAALGQRLSAALAHAHLLVLHPRDAQAAALQALLDAGWSTTQIVTLSQLVAFLSFQIRVVAGLRVLAAAALPVARAPLLSTAH